MKRSYLLLACALLSLAAMAGNITQHYSFGGPKLESHQGFDLITFNDTYLTGKTGEPSLPYHSIRILLPPGEEAADVKILFGEEVLLDGTYRLFPQQPSRPLSEGTDGEFFQDEAVYNSNVPYPGQTMGPFTTHFQNGHSILISSFTPVKYTPSTGQLSYYKQVTVEIGTHKTSRGQNALENLCAEQGVSRIAAFIQNPELLKEYPVKENRDDNYDILVVTPQQFVSAFDEYRLLYLIRGMKTEIMSVEDIGSLMSGQDLQEKLRNYIIQEYQDHAIEFVLLGGDVEHVPYRGFYCFVDSGWGYEDNDIPADLYYSALDGTWNDDGDNSWGEIGEDDLLPDVSVARWPFSTSEQLQRLLVKTGRYQDDPVTGELQRPLLAGEHLWSDPETWGGDYMDLLIGHHEDNGYVTDGIPETDDILKYYERDGGWDKWDLIDAVNEGRSFIHHSGHANQSSVMKLNTWDITNQNFSQANGVDHNYTLVYTHGCLCGAFDDNDCIAEAMVMIDNFAVAGAFNSRYGWFNEGQTEGPSQHLHREFVDALYDQQENRIGTTHMISKVNTSAWVNAPGQHEEGALRWCFYGCNILGDPALAVWTAEPMAIDVQYPAVLQQGDMTFTVSVSSSGEAIEEMMCVMMSGDEMIGCCMTDENGQAVIEMPGGFSGEEAELVVSGYHCQPRHFPVNVQVGLQKLAISDNIHLYPIPCQNYLHLDIPDLREEKMDITVMIPDGRTVEKIRVESFPGRKSLTLDAASWPDGLLLIRMTTINLDLIRKVVKQ